MRYTIKARDDRTGVTAYIITIRKLKMVNSYYEKLISCVEEVKAKINGFEPHIAIVSGSALKPISKDMDVRYSVPYSEIKGMPVCTVERHESRFLFGYMNGVPTVCMTGRIHYYEGYDIQDVVLPIRIMCLLGAKLLLLTNASGGLDPDTKIPTLMVIRDHIMLHFPNPLIGPNPEELGLRYPDMSTVYDPEISGLLFNLGKEMDIPMSEGVYVQLTGPSFETPAEIRFLGKIGGDAVGMSTACEAVAARHLGVKVCGISCITNLGAGISQNELTDTEVVENTGLIIGQITALINAALPKIDRDYL